MQGLENYFFPQNHYVYEIPINTIGICGYNVKAMKTPCKALI